MSLKIKIMDVIFLTSALLSGCQNGTSSEHTTAARATATANDLADAAARCGQPAPTGNLTPVCVSDPGPDGKEPPCNPHLAQDAWSAAHRGNFAQASSPLPGVTAPSQINITHTALTAAPIILNFTEPDHNGHRAVWASTVGFTGEIDKIDADTMKVLGRYTPPSSGSLSTSGAYNLLDRDQRLIVGQASNLQVFGDETPGDHHSGITQLANFSLPEGARCGNRKDELVGITMLPDGHVAFATKFGMVGVIPRQPETMCAANLQLYSINGTAKCNDSSVPDSDLEQVSNSIAADERSNLYVVTSAAQHRINWDGSSLSHGWSSAYPGAGGSGSGRLGAGSGSTPTLMGLPSDRDRFVVITDGQKLMHLILMWRDDIPGDWKPLRDGIDRRIACEIPVDFGNPDATESLSEQSVLVRGFASIIVNNLMKLNSLLAYVPSQLQPYTQLLSGLSINKPQGVQRIDWDPATRSCHAIWANPNVSLPMASRL